MKNYTRIFSRVGFAAIAATLMVGAASDEAQAGGRVFIGGGVIVGTPYYAYPPYYGYPYYAYPPSTVYVAPPVYAAPPANYVYAPPPPAPTDQYYNAPDGRYCREYTHTITVNGQPSSAYGHACQQPDGAWKIID